MPLQAFLSLTQQVRIPLCSRRYQINRMIHEVSPVHTYFLAFSGRSFQLLQPEI